jgi:predicted TIM-barrel fold metal-dependent hydrolase
MEKKTAKDYQIIDSDTHITEPPDVWTSRVAAKFKDKVPCVRLNVDGKTESWFLGDKYLADVGHSANAGWEAPFPSHPPTYQAAHHASWDANERLKYMDEINCWAQVLYPNIGGFGSQEFLKLGDPELMLACVSAYNDFQLDWISPDPQRFVPIMAMPFWDVPAMVKEMNRCAKRGYKGILFTAAPQDFGLPVMGDRHWDPFYAAAQDAGLPISFHIGSGKFLEESCDSYTPKRIATDGWEATYGRATVNLFFGNAVQLNDLLFSGVLPRFPKLRFVSVESGIGWIPFLLDAADYHFEVIQLSKARPEFTMKPSEYFRRQVYGCYWFESTIAEEVKKKVGVRNIMFETDFPHVTCLYGNVAERIEAGLGNEPEAIRRRILFDNAAELYGLPLA